MIERFYRAGSSSDAELIVGFRFVNHLIRLGDSWSCWTYASLRATGFPARLILELASDELAAAADRLVEQEAELERRREVLIAACKTAADHVPNDQRSALQLAVKRLRQDRVPDSLSDVSAEAMRQQLVEVIARRDALVHALGEHHARAQRATSQALRRFGGDDRFRQALLWQNRAAVRGSVAAMLRQPIEATDSKTRQHESLVASYVQRYCVKNDTIGFFGPVGWARFGDRPVLLEQRPGASLLASRTIYYEYWAIDALATKLSEDPAVRPFIAPRRLPRYRIEGTTLHYPIARQTELSLELAAVASRCDGVRTARDIARELSRDPTLELPEESDVFAVLDELVASRVIVWTFEIPTAGPHPDHHLSALLARIEDVEARGRAEAALDELHRYRAAVAASADATQLDLALTAFDAAFTRATDADSQRSGGQTYAGRTPLYEDCRRDLDVEIGRPFLERLAPPLELLMVSARWFSYEIASRYRRALAALYHRLRSSEGDPVVDFSRFWQEVPALFPGGATSGSIVGEVRDELRRRWAAVLAIDPAERLAQRRATALADEVHRTFSAPGPGWPAARHHSPDVMIAAAGPAALERGEYQIVIGEIHAGFSTLAAPVFVKQHPFPDEIIAARAADIGRSCIAPVWSKAVTRADYYSPSPHDLDLENGETRSARPRAQVLAVSELVIDERDGLVVVRTRDGAHSFDLITFFEHHLIAESFAAFSPIEPAPWTPRVTIDDVVIARATWRITPAELAWPALKEQPARFVAARRWARSLGMPRWVFVKTPEEVKPMYVDFDSTVYVEILAKLLRGASAASLSEMLPTVEQAWVVDATGERYTSELRIVAVDPLTWQPEAVR